jgi:DNA-directed RNA polymerase subunit M/transcription elongation factor TFIIS
MIETKTYLDGTTATGRSPLPARSPRQQDEECPQCYSIEWDRVTAERGRERDVPFKRCHHCGNEWEAD